VLGLLYRQEKANLDREDAKNAAEVRIAKAAIEKTKNPEKKAALEAKLKAALRV
jgi:hypothetical protein